MSTTVSYKGQTLTTVSNDTKTLLTEGKYLEDDLTLVDVSGGGSTLITKSISANGTYNASSDSADGYSQVNVAVPASAVDTGTKNITANGSNQDVVGYAAVDVAVPNSYSASDEGKVVSNGALVAQTSDTVTANDTYDTTLINSLTVNVSGGGGSGSFDLLNTVTLTEAVTAVQLNFDSSWDDYDAIFMVSLVALSASDWVYMGFNKTNGGNYTTSGANALVMFTGIKSNGSWLFRFCDHGNAGGNYTGTLPSYFHMRTYTSGKTMNSGNVFSIYGGKLS